MKRSETPRVIVITGASAGLGRAAAIHHTCATRFRPVLMISVAASVGLLPAAISTGIGSQVQRPLALVVVGGMVFAPVPILIILPVLVSLLSGHRSSAEATEAPVGAAD